MRVVSSVPAPSTMPRALKSITSRVFASMTRTPVALFVASSTSTSETIEYGRTVTCAGVARRIDERRRRVEGGLDVAAASAAAAAGAVRAILCSARRRW